MSSPAKVNPYPHSPISPDAKVRHEITAGLRANEDLIYRFASAWYQSPYTFLQTRVLGHAACKIPLDLWVFMDLFTQYRFETVIECGTAAGGSTLWFALLQDMLQIEGGQVVSIDLEFEPKRPQHPRISYIRGSTTDPAVQAQALARFSPHYSRRAAPVLVNLDSDHHAPHVLNELRLWAPLVPVGSWLVVEDTNGSPVVEDPITGEPHGVEGSLAAVMEYMQAQPGEWLRDVSCERYWLTMNPHGWLQRQKPYVERSR